MSKLRDAAQQALEALEEYRQKRRAVSVVRQSCERHPPAPGGQGMSDALTAA